MNIIKRSGAEAPFDKQKIVAAISKANASVDEAERIPEGRVRWIADRIEAEATGATRALSVEEVQDKVEEALMSEGYFSLARSYITYRYEHAKFREDNALMEKLTASNVQNQNANVDESSFSGRMGETLSLITKKFALEHLMSPKSARNHVNNEIYIHDLDSYAVGMHNCAERTMWVKIMEDDLPRLVRIGDLADEIGVGYNQIADTSKSNIYILSRDGWTKLLNISKRKLRDSEKLYTIKTRTGIPVKVTEDHLLPIIRDGKEILVKAKEIAAGDCLLDIESVKLSSEEYNECFLNLTSVNDSDTDIRVVNLSPIRHYVRYKYGIVFLDYIKSKGFKMQSNGRYGETLTLSEFNQLCNDYPLSFDVLNEVRIKGCGSKHSYPLHIPFSVDLAKLYGYIYGDGGVYIRKDNSQYQLTFTNTNMALMEDFVKCYANVFGYKLKVYVPTDKSNSPCLRVVDGSIIPCKIFKDFAGARKYGAADISIPDFIMNGDDDIKYGFLAAAIYSDGSVSGRNVVYTTCGDKYSDQMMLLLQSLGYHPSKVKSFSKGSVYRFGRKSGKRNFDVFNVVLYRKEETDQIKEKMWACRGQDKKAYKGLSNKFNESKVFSVTSSTGDYDVFDVETDSHWFILNNYVSHNCLSIPFDKLLAEGFTVRQCDVRPAGSINTALQLVAVIFQLQSLQQFGGVSATNLDHSLVPYVRKSFLKHFKDGLKYIEGMSDEEIDKVMAEVSGAA